MVVYLLASLLKPKTVGTLQISLHLLNLEDVMVIYSVFHVRVRSHTQNDSRTRRGIPPGGCGSKLTGRGKPQVLVHSTYQGSIFRAP